MCLSKKYDLSKSIVIRVDFTGLAATIGDGHFVNWAADFPEMLLTCLGLIAHSTLLPSSSPPNYHHILPYSSNLLNHGDMIQSAPLSEYPDRLKVRLFNWVELTEVRELKSTAIDKIKAVRGTVVRVSNIKPILLQSGVECSKCISRWMMHCTDGTPEQPRACIKRDCPNQAFTLIRETSTTTDWQRIRLQEICEATAQGRVPITKDVEVTGDLVDCCVPGDHITVVGIIRAVSTSETRGKGNRGVGRGGVALNSKRGGKQQEGSAASPASKSKAPLYDNYIEALSIENTKMATTGGGGGGGVATSGPNSELSVKDMYAVLSIANHHSPFALICASLCPTIFGNYLVKAGLVLSMFGGSVQHNDMQSGVSMRSDIHVLIVGDPGLGKSQLLIGVSNLAPRGIYVCGSYSTTTGLTVSIQKEAGSHDYTLEAGALVLANNGVACIDELDKMPSDIDALLEAMEQQQISVAKAGIVCNVPARASIIAAANPKCGHYDKSKTIAENLNMSTAILSRFDLIFVLLDKSNAIQDDLISEHIISQHASYTTKLEGVNQQNDIFMDDGGKEVPLPSQAPNKMITTSTQIGSTPMAVPVTLLQRLEQHDPKSEGGIIPPATLNKYISYAKKYVEPKLSHTAKLVLQDFYLSLRRSNQSQDGTPVTTRQLESLIRLAEARAKVELRTEVTESDARDVIEILKSSLRDAMDSDGFEAVDIGATGKRGKTKVIHLFVDNLQKKSKLTKQSEYTKQELYNLSKEWKLVPPSSFDDFIDSLNHQGYLIRLKGNLWKVFGVN